ncbi:hypothetical protein AB1Y20_010692 [Prymnesium parvum]|uniref:NYN domain-containing protein n=1 Tax=Prymnesium parvum TaxID=97485 RepID=A0AB34ISK4_PRYPA
MRWLAWLLCAAAAAACGGTRGRLLHHLRANQRAVLIIDGNNVRGADCFATSQEEMTCAVEAWSAAEGLPAILMLDHGPEQRAWRRGARSVVVLAGPTQTADDVIVRDSLWLRHERKCPVFVVTSDAGLIARTRQYRAATCAGVQLLPSSLFVELVLREYAGAEGGAAEGQDRGGAQGEHAKYGAVRRARVKESTGMRVRAADELSDHLSRVPPESELGVRDMDSSSVAASVDIDVHGVVEITEPCCVLDDYVDWVNELAPRGRKHADPVGLAPSPSMKRRLRRKRRRG